MKNDTASQAGRAMGEALSQWCRGVERSANRMDAILDAYIRSGRTGRSYGEEREALFRKRGLGTKDD